MAERTFTVEHASMTVEVGMFGFSSGFVVIRHESGQPDAYASRLFQTRPEAEDKAKALRTKAARSA